MVADMLSRPPTAVTSVAACQGGKAESGTVATVAAHAPLGGLCYTAMVAAQAACPAVTKGVSSPSLRIQRVIIAGAEVVCDVSSGWSAPSSSPPTSRQCSPPFIGWPTWASGQRDGWSAAISYGMAARQTDALVQRLPRVPTWQGHQAAGGGGAGNNSTGETVQPSTCGFGGTTPHISRWYRWYIVTIIDRFTRWLEVVPVKNMEVTTL